ncbi:DUF1772 domain-containing protein [Chengkuizengella axinellae]|uniref:DUF1772 domain-containing protein n=1 Tax=Chengkuizengella axinellae TaxID=3064388 RepID=A0ABT9J5Y3_9BACL|nr:DUF1772 domain-containing protein [Chengkuizengella sp. 2205SS18-9]MDP5277030.1 DUF1772 domain-containing protein [Chengkuizengella sp. 2205SS18-9]
MKTSYYENGTLAIALLIIGIMAGFFYTYTINVNLAMLEVSGEIYATVQSLFNENVRHFMFFIFFFGGGVASVIAVLANIKYYKTISFWLIVSAGIIYIFGIIIFTAQVNLPLNYETESWNPQALPKDWEQTRDDWNQANSIRVLFSMLSFILYILVLVIRASKK